MSGPNGPVFFDGPMSLAPGSDVDIPAIRQKIVDLISGQFPELRPYARAEPAAAIQPPAVMSYPIDRISYDETFDGGSTIVMPVRIYLRQSEDATDQDTLDGYIAPRGTKSVAQFMAGHSTLDGTVEDCRVVAAQNYGLWPIANVPFLGVEFVFEIKV